MENIHTAVVKKKVVLGVIFAVSLILCATWYVKEKNCVKPAIYLWQALQQRDNKQYFMIGMFSDFGNGEYYYLEKGQKIPVYLFGRTPLSELSWHIAGSEAGNLFLIKGCKDLDLSERLEQEAIMVESWDIIAPIHRAYESENPYRRLFSPSRYLDKYDVETGAYYDVVTDIRAIHREEEDSLRNTEGLPCYIITSDIIDNKVQWYIKEEGTLSEINIAGSTPEKHFNEVILLNKLNTFLVKGELDRDGETLVIEQWHIRYPIRRYNYTSVYESQDFFEQKDIEQRIYIP